MPKVTIDGQSLEVEPGTTVLLAARRLGIAIPTFCFHPGLSIPANCRMCLVEIAGNPKLQPSCSTQVSEGLVVETASERVREARRAVLELILLSHPVDCPICDQAGECVLQEHYRDHSARPSRLAHPKLGKGKAIAIGPRVVLDRERCIVCTRCVRFCEEVAHSSDLAVGQRGEQAEITTFPGRQLDNPYSLNCVDICPVGALTDRSFRFKRRVWFLSKRDSVCTGCGRVCSARIDSFRNEFERILPRSNPDLNRWWLCDAGRDQMRASLRALPPVGRLRGEPRPLPELVHELAVWLTEATVDGRPLGLAVSASLANEDLWALSHLARALEARVFLCERSPWTGDRLLRADDRDCNDAGARAVLGAVLGSFSDGDGLAGSLPELHGLLVIDNGARADDDLLAAVAAHPRVAVLAPEEGALAAAAGLVLPATALHRRDGTLVNVEGRVQRLLAPLLPWTGTLTPAALAGRLAAEMEISLPFASDVAPEVLFAALAGAVPALAGLTWAACAGFGASVGEGESVASAATGSALREPDAVHPTASRPFALQRGCERRH
jgi:NADH-quinone oxidoreductase subunit G